MRPIGRLECGISQICRFSAAAGITRGRSISIDVLYPRLHLDPPPLQIGQRPAARVSVRQSAEVCFGLVDQAREGLEG